MKTTFTHIQHSVAVSIFCLFNISVLHAQGTGVIDSSFGRNGAMLTKIAANRDDISQSVAVTPDNKIVVAGNSFNILGYSNIGVVRYKTNGALDKTFNGSGKKIINNGFCNVVAVQTDKKIVIGGSVAVGSNTLFGLWRLNADGSNDNSFGNNGYTTVAFSGYVICFAMKLQPDGKILIGGNDGNFYAGNSSLILARLNTNGTLDSSFSGDGKFSLNLTRKSLTCNEILIQPNGDIIATGQLDTVVRPNFINSFFATRLHSNGTTDVSFGNNGIVRVKNSISDVAYCAGLLPNGKIIMGGFSQVSGKGDITSVLGLTANGAIDNTFGTNGWVYPSFYGATGILNAAVVQQNGKIIFAGTIYNTNQTTSIGLVRLNGNGSLDPTFANNGLDTFYNSTNALDCRDAILQADNKILTTGYFAVTNDAFFTTRFLNSQQFAISNSKTDANISANNNVGIVKNPVSDNILELSLNLKMQTHIAVAVYTLDGRQIMNAGSFNAQAGLIQKNIQLPSSIQNGNYLCVIKMNGEIKTLQFMVLK